MAYVVGTLTKDPDETRIYKMDWSAHLGTLLIAASTWTVPSGLTEVTSGIVTGNTKTYVTLAGGTANTNYTVTNTVTIASTGEIYQRSGRLDVRQY